MEKKIAEHAQVLQGHFAAAATERNRLRQLQESYHVRASPVTLTLARPTLIVDWTIRVCGLAIAGRGR